MKLSIVIAAYNRPDSLKRLLRSLQATVFPKRCKPDRFVFFDGHPSELVELSNETLCQLGGFDCRWDKHVGLKDHLIRCLNLGLENHDACILLEDDLFVSPYFLHWCIEALEMSQGTPELAAISLYSPVFNEYAGLPFIPLHNGCDSYFMQVPASSGVCWTKPGWRDFITFVKAYPVIHETAPLPAMVKGWPADTSLKKHLAHYLEAINKTYLYPRVSFATNFGDTGTHCESLTHKFQVPIHSGPWHELSWGCDMRYDAFMEPRLFVDNCEPDCDFFGLKPPMKGLRISCRPHSNPIRSWGMRMIPPEANVFYDIPGDDIHMGEADGFADPTPDDRQKLVNLYSRFTLPTSDWEHYWRKRATQCQGWADAGDKKQYNQGRADAFQMCADEWGKVPKLN